MQKKIAENATFHDFSCIRTCIGRAVWLFHLHEVVEPFVEI